MTLAAVKAALRGDMAARRAAAHAGGQGAATAHLRAALAGHGGQVLAGYMPMRTEIDPLPAMAAHDGPVCVPVVTGRGLPLRFREWSPGCIMETGAYGVQVPAAGRWLVPQVLIVPMLAWDRRGYRLGYGGGFYDRTLADLRALGPVTAIGLAFAAQEVPEVPIEGYDLPLDLIVTEAGAITPAR